MPNASTNSWAILTFGNQLYWQENGSNLGGSGYGTIPLNAWAHLAVTRSGTTTRWFVNGVQVNSVTNSFNYSGAPANRSIGPRGGGGSPAYVSDFRILKGQAVYTSNFVPPIAPLQPVPNTTLLLNGTGAAITDATTKNILETVADARISTVQSKFGGSSIFFDGTGDNLAMSSDTVPIGTGDFTIEGWFWLGAIADTYYNLYTSGIFGIRYGNSGFANRLQFGYDLNTVGSIYSCVIQTGNNQNLWAHVAWTRSGGVNRLFYNGVQQNLGTGINPATYPSASFSNSSSPPTGGIIGVGWLGYIQDFRITRGIARYTANFTPPTTAHQTR
jgi:hypothetical protein